MRHGLDIGSSSPLGRHSAVQCEEREDTGRTLFSLVEPFVGLFLQGGLHAGLFFLQGGLYAGLLFLQGGLHAGLLFLQGGLHAGLLFLQGGLHAGLLFASEVDGIAFKYLKQYTALNNIQQLKHNATAYFLLLIRAIMQFRKSE